MAVQNRRIESHHVWRQFRLFNSRLEVVHRSYPRPLQASFTFRKHNALALHELKDSVLCSFAETVKKAYCFHNIFLDTVSLRSNCIPRLPNAFIWPWEAAASNSRQASESLFLCTLNDYQVGTLHGSRLVPRPAEKRFRFPFVYC